MVPTKKDARKIVECARYMNQLGKDLLTVFSTAESIFQKEHLFPIKSRDWDLSRPWEWFPLILGKPYCRVDQGAGKLDDRVFMVEAHLAPTFTDEPSIVLGKVTFPRRDSPRDLLDAWGEDGDWLGSVLVRGKDSITVSGNGAREVWRGASEIRLRSVPLVALRNEQEVKDRLVNPLLDLDKRA